MHPLDTLQAKVSGLRPLLIFFLELREQIRDSIWNQTPSETKVERTIHRTVFNPEGAATTTCLARDSNSRFLIATANEISCFVSLASRGKGLERWDISTVQKYLEVTILIEVMTDMKHAEDVGAVLVRFDRYFNYYKIQFAGMGRFAFTHFFCHRIWYTHFMMKTGCFGKR